MTNRTSYATRIRRSGSTRIEPDRFRVVSPLRRTDRQDERSHHRRRSNNVNFAPYTEAETASSKFQWDNLLDAKQLENESSSSRSFASRFSGSGPLGLTGPPRSYSGFVSPLKESEAVHLPPMHCEHQHLGYGFSVSRTPPSQFGEKSGLFRNVGIGTDCNFEHMHVQIPKPNSVEVSNNNKNRVLNYSEVQKSEKSDGGFMSSEFQRSSIMDSIVEKIDGALGNIDSLRKRTPWEEEKEDEQHLVAPSKCIDFIQPSNYCVEPLCCSRHVVPEYRDNEESWSLRGYEKSAYTYSDYQGNCKVLPVLDDDEIKETEVEMFDSSYGVKTFENQIWNDFNAASSHPHRRCMHGPSMDADANASFGDVIVRVKFDDRPQKSRYSPVPAERTSAKNEMATRISVKKRLRYFGGRIIHLPSSQGFCSKNVHARLGPRVVLAEEPCDAVQHAKMKKIKRIFCEISRSAPCSDPSSESEVKEKAKHSKRSKTEPPEDSKEFKQLVQNAFFKFVKLLNENPSQRRKYIDREGIDTLRCTLCGSKSKEFANTHSLAMHAFNSTKVRHRAEHLGFHKALCVLLGWRDTPSSDGLWVREALPAAEASNLKNDLIIWAPVVLIHNSSVANSNPDKRVIISIEELETILRGMGFGGGKTKVSRGKPANYSILVVTFNATFSGLQEAERLHKFYSDKHHGREEFQQIDDGGCVKNSYEGTQGIPKNEENVLYGYLGNAGDFDKLDFESKKHSVVKSKKEIQAIVDDTLKAL